MKVTKRILVWMLTLAMLVTMLPTNVIPTDAAVAENAVYEDVASDAVPAESAVYEAVPEDCGCNDCCNLAAATGEACGCTDGTACNCDGSGVCGCTDCGDQCTDGTCSCSGASYVITEDGEIVAAEVVSESDSIVDTVTDSVDPDNFSIDNFKANIEKVSIEKPITLSNGKRQLPVKVHITAKENLSDSELEGYLRAKLRNGKLAEGISGLGMTLTGPLKPDVPLDYSNMWCWQWDGEKFVGTGAIMYYIPLLNNEDEQTVEKSLATGQEEVNGLKVGDEVTLQNETWLSGLPEDMDNIAKSNEFTFKIEDDSAYPKEIKTSGGSTCKHPASSLTYTDNKDGLSHTVTCGKCGEIVNSMELHMMMSSSNKKISTCSKCGYSITRDKKDMKNAKVVMTEPVTTQSGSDNGGVVDPSAGWEKNESDKWEYKDPEKSFTELETKQVGLADKTTGEAFVAEKDYTKEVTPSSDGKFWEIVMKPIEGKAVGDPILVEVRKADNKTHNVTVNYVFDPSGETAAATVVHSYKEDEEYSITSPLVLYSNKGKDGKPVYYQCSSPTVFGRMGKEDVTRTVKYKYEENFAELLYKVVINYMAVDNKTGYNGMVALPVVMEKKYNETYLVKSPPVEGYYPNIEAVSGTVKGNKVVDVYYYPLRKVTVKYNFPTGGSFEVTQSYHDGAKYSIDSKSAISDQTAGQLGMILKEGSNIPKNATFDMTNVWTPYPAVVSGTINGMDVYEEVNFTCAHPSGGRRYVDGGTGDHFQECGLCNQYVAGTTAAHTLTTKGQYLDKNALPEEIRDDPKYKNGANAYSCTKGCGYIKYESADEETCPAATDPNDMKHIWQPWEKVSETECSRTCARCKKTVTVAHQWGEWKSSSSKNHIRSCEHCHTIETGTHGNWSGVKVTKEATCIAHANVSAHCGICDTDVPDVFYGIVGAMENGDKYVPQGHQFDGGYANLYKRGHTQKCSACGAYDMENVEEHTFGDWYVKEQGQCGGQTKYERACSCGYKETKTEEKGHNFVRDTAREVNPTCEAPGTECYTCTDCGEHDDKTVEKLGHNMVEDEGNYPATCEKAGRISKHCSNPGCDETSLEEPEKLSPNGQHKWVPHITSKPTCTFSGQSEGEECEYCHKTRNEKNIDYPEKLGHNIETDTQVLRSSTHMNKTGNAVVYEEVRFTTYKCTRCGYTPKPTMYTVARTEKPSKYKILWGDAHITDMSNGVHITGQMGKDNSVYVYQKTNEAFNERIKIHKEAYSMESGSIITTFTDEFMNSLDDGEYELMQFNGDEAYAATLTVKDHKIVKTEDGIDSLELDPEDPETYMDDGEYLFYLGEAGENAYRVDGGLYVPQIAGMKQLEIPNYPVVTTDTPVFDKVDGNTSHADVIVIKNDKGHTFNAADPIHHLGEALPAKEMVPAETEDAEPRERTNYTIEGDKITLTADFLSSLGEGDNIFTFNYTDAPEAQLTITVSGGISKQEAWNLLESGEAHVYSISGVLAPAEGIANSNAASAKYYDAKLAGNKITVRLLADVDRKAAAKNNTFEFVVPDQGTVSYTLPLTYSKPALKLSSTKGTVRQGVSRRLKTTVMVQNEDGNYVPLDLADAEVTDGSGKKLGTGTDGAVYVTASSKAAVKINVKKAGWNEAITLAYTVNAIAANKDVLEVDLGGLKQVVLNTNAPEQTLYFPLYLNGDPAGPADVSIDTSKKGYLLGSVEDGVLGVSLGRSGVTKGSYTLNLVSGKAKLKVKVKVSDKALTSAATGKVKQKYDVVTGQPMIIVPTLKEVSGTITGVTLKSPANFTASLEDGNISLAYSGETPMTAADLNIGDVSLDLTVDGISSPVGLTLKKVKAKKTTPTLKAAKVTVSKDAPASGDVVIATVNIVSTYKDSSKTVRAIAPIDAKVDPKNVIADIDPNNAGRVLITGLTGNSGTVKVTLTYPGGVTKAVAIKVGRAK